MTVCLAVLGLLKMADFASLNSNTAATDMQGFSFGFMSTESNVCRNVGNRVRGSSAAGRTMVLLLFSKLQS
jgi:hypothetical protein